MSSALLVKKNLRFNDLRSEVLTGGSKSEHWRRFQLGKIHKLLDNHESDILFALQADLGKPSTEAMIEIIALKQELKLANRNLKKWMRPKAVNIPISLRPGEATLRLEPLGCVLIIGPWNYPFSLTIQPLISAFAAGNTAVLKPSENSPNTSRLIANLFKSYFPENIVQVFEGDKDVAKTLLEYPFDHVFFTGSTSIGQKVLEAASKHLSPVTLELGGKSPVLILKGSDLEVAARRILWGKGLNSGQTCLAPNHLLIQESIKEPFLKEIKKAFLDFYGPNPINSNDLAQIINDVQFLRLVKLLDGAREKNQILFGGEINRAKRLITPALIKVDIDNDPILQDEIFGPLLPISTFSNFSDAIKSINKDSSPLAIYMFGGSQEEQKQLIKQTRSGGICFNDVIMQAGIPEMPFGGVGQSGMGRYHGFAGFQTFSNERSVLKRPFWLDFKLRYPPYKLNLDLLKKLLS